MNQDQLIILLFKVVLISGAASVTLFIAVYWRLAPWWRNEIGRTIVVKDFLLIACLMPSILSLFFHFSRLTSYVAAWTDVALFGLLTPVMLWRVRVWHRVHKNKETAGDRDES